MEVALGLNYNNPAIPVEIPHIPQAGKLDIIGNARQKLTHAKVITETAYLQCLFSSALDQLVHANPDKLEGVDFIRSQENDKLQGFAFTLPVSEKRKNDEVYEFYVLNLVGSSKEWFAVHRAPANGEYLAATIDSEGKPKLVSPDAYKSPQKHHLSIVPVISINTLSTDDRANVHRLLHGDGLQAPKPQEPNQHETRYQLPRGYKMRRLVISRAGDLKHAIHTVANYPVDRLLFGHQPKVKKRGQKSPAAIPTIAYAQALPQETPPHEVIITDERTQALLDLHRINPYQIIYTQERHPTGVEFVWFEFSSGGKKHRIAVYEDTAEHMVINADGTKTFLSRPQDLTGEYTDLLDTIHRAVLNGKVTGQLKVSTPLPTPIQAASLLDIETLKELGETLMQQKPKKITNGPLFTDGDPNGVREYYQSHPKNSIPTPVLAAYSTPFIEPPSYHEIFSAGSLVSEGALPSWMKSASPQLPTPPDSSGSFPSRQQFPHAFRDNFFNGHSLLDPDIDGRLSWLDPDSGVDIAKRKTQPLHTIPRQTSSSLFPSPQALFDSQAPQIQQAAARLNISAMLGNNSATDTKQIKTSKQGGSPLQVKHETLATVARRFNLPRTEFIDERSSFGRSSSRNRFSPSY